MRALFRPIVHHLKWPVRVGAFILHIMHHLAAFFAWIWMFVHMAGTLAQAGWQASKLWELITVDEIWSQGIGYFSSAGGVEWQKMIALAVIPAFFVALSNSYATYEQFKAWVHDHKAAQQRR